MANKENESAGTAGIQVFELTMDNPEDQDELNRRLHKPGESNNGANGCKVKDPSATVSPAEKKSRTND
jgi:hypothetical protein